MLRPAALIAAIFTLAIGAAAWAQDGLARLNVEESQLSASQAANLGRLARLLSVLQQLGRDPPPALLVSPEDAKKAVRAAILVRSITPELERRAQAHAREAGEMARQRRLAAVRSEMLFETESRTADALDEPDNSAEAMLRPTQRLATRPPPGLIAPVAGRIEQRFGDPLAGGGRALGMTLAAPRGAKVVSPAAGTVQFVGPVKGWGVIAILRLAGGYYLVLAGLERTDVVVGQPLAAGQTVGWAPKTRQATTGLYVEVRNQGSPVDPGRWLMQ
jgi:murein hydrolase activator